MIQEKICFIGAGNMTYSIIGGLIHSGYDASLIYVTNPSAQKLEKLKRDFGVNTSHDNLAFTKQADVVLLSVKPQVMQEVCNQISELDLSDKLLITIAAGIPQARYGEYCSQDVRLIRTMPNTPMQIGVGMTGIYADNTITQRQKLVCETLMSAGGEVVWVDREEELDQVIALSGSSPAYFFMFMDAMITKALQMGMDETKARALVQQAALGAAQMVKQNPQISVAQLRKNVTSKGGTTAQALATFEQGGLAELIGEAMDNCMTQAKEMSNKF